MERSLFSARHCFVENLHDSGKMSDAEFSVLCEWFDFLASGNLSSVDVGVDLIIYLRTEPEVAYERKKSRARKEEEVRFLTYYHRYFGEGSFLILSHLICFFLSSMPNLFHRLYHWSTLKNCIVYTRSGFLIMTSFQHLY